MWQDSNHRDLFSGTDALDALSDLERNTSEAVISQRASARLEIRTKICIRPGNASQRQKMAIQGLTGDISNGGCLVLAGRPLVPGDIYWLTFSDDDIRLGSMFARCVRCRMIRDDTYEMGFCFFNDVDLAGATKHREHDPQGDRDLV